MRKRTGSVAERRVLADEATELDAGHPRQVPVEHEQVEARRAHALEGLFGARRRLDGRGPRRRASRPTTSRMSRSSSTSSTRALGPCANGSLARQWREAGRARARRTLGRLWTPRGSCERRLRGRLGRDDAAVDDAHRACCPPRRSRRGAPSRAARRRATGPAPAPRCRPRAAAAVARRALADLEDGEHPLAVVDRLALGQRQLLVPVAQGAREGRPSRRSGTRCCARRLATVLRARRPCKAGRAAMLPALCGSPSSGPGTWAARWRASRGGAGHEVRLWGTWLDDPMLEPCERGEPHPRLKLRARGHRAPPLAAPRRGPRRARSSSSTP